MKFIIALVLTALLGYAAPLFLPWWAFVLTSAVVALSIHQKPGKAFASGFLGLFLLWGVHAFILDSANDHMLSGKVAAILPMGGSYMAIILVTAVIGGLLSGFAALSGSFARLATGNGR